MIENIINIVIGKKKHKNHHCVLIRKKNLLLRNVTNVYINVNK